MKALPPSLLLKTLWSESQGVGLMQYYVVSKVRWRLIIPDLLWEEKDFNFSPTENEIMK